MNIDLRYDLMVEEKVLVELKSQETVPPVAYKVFKTYLRLTNISIGLLINFNVGVLREGIKRIANGVYRAYLKNGTQRGRERRINIKNKKLYSLLLN